MIRIENNDLLVELQTKGAELTRIYHKQNDIEYMWKGGPEWPKHSPVLFPIVGALKDDKYYHNKGSYSLPRHGFAREKEFHVLQHSQSEAEFTLNADDQTKGVYPFPFSFRIRYVLMDDSLTTSYIVTNEGDSDMFFSVGGHPAFSLPISPGTEYSDYYLKFEKPETVDRWPIVEGGLLSKTSMSFLQGADTVPLRKELFHKDAVVLKGLRSRRISILSEKTNHGLEFDYTGFPYLGLWAAPDADFVCIEPWCGVADSENSNQVLETKEGIQLLRSGEVFERSWQVRVF